MYSVSDDLSLTNTRTFATIKDSVSSGVSVEGIGVSVGIISGVVEQAPSMIEIRTRMEIFFIVILLVYLVLYYLRMKHTI